MAARVEHAGDQDGDDRDKDRDAHADHGERRPLAHNRSLQEMRGHLSVLVLVAAALLVVGCASTRPRATASATAAPPSGILFGLGPEADSARRTPLVRQAPVRMLTSWFNGPGDLSWMGKWRSTVVLPAYRKGFALHLVVWDGGPEGPIDTPYGAACGRAYALSGQFLSDMRVLARTFAGGPHDALYVTLFAEFQTYPCHDNAWSPDPQTTAYYEALKDQYRAALQVFHQQAPDARVSLGWGGWQASWNNPATGGGRSLFAHFADVMKLSGFQSFQSLQSPTAVRDAVAMTRALAPYGPVMLAFYKPSGAAGAAQQAQLSAFLSQANLGRLHRSGLFAISFMDTSFMSDPTALGLIESAVKSSGCVRCASP